MLEKIRLHGANYIGEYLDGGSAAHLNSDTHMSAVQYAYLLKYAAEKGCQYLTWNIPNCECEDCHYISKTPFSVCPKCGSKNVAMWDRIIGYLTKIKNWSEGRQIEQKTRVYEHFNEEIE
jgi:ribonucleoside-triphosphate reductase